MQAGSGSSCSLLLADGVQVQTAQFMSFPRKMAWRNRPVPCSAAEQTHGRVCLYTTICSNCLRAHVILALES